MIDLHCHLLPGIDDGARTLEDSLAMAELAIAEGITHILVTPHHKNGSYENVKTVIEKKTAELQAEFDKRDIALTLFPGQEVRLNGELLTDVYNDEILFADLDNQYLLIEFPTLSIPHYAESLCFQLHQKGITPVIVHPERNQAVIADPNTLLPFIERGALAQLTASSYVGIFGKEIAELSSRLIEANLVHIIASDAHNTRGRSFHMREAFVKLEAEFGGERVLDFQQNAKAIINGDMIQTAVPMEVLHKKQRFGFLKKRWGR